MIDILIKNGTIVDGTGKARYQADIAIYNGMIYRIAPTITLDAKVTIDAAGKVVSPGFIDYHSHADAYFLFGTDGYNMLEQGVTTEITGHCGSSIVPYFEGQLDDVKGLVPDEVIEQVKNVVKDFKSFENTVSKMKMATNMAFYAGHGSIRGRVMGYSKEKPAPAQLEDMKAWVTEAMECGFIGLSSGLIYPPSVYADQSELTELSGVVAQYDGSYTSHIRGEGDTVIKAVAEAISIGEESGCNVVISHHKISGKKNAGQSSITLGLIEEANARGKIRVRTDQYPFIAGQTSLISALPHIFSSDGPKALMERLTEKDFRRKVTAALQSDDVEPSLIKDSGFEGCLVLSAPKTPEVIGKNIKQIACERKIDPYDAIYDVIIENDGAVSMAYFHINEQDMMAIIQKPYVMVGADSGHNIEHFDTETIGGGHPRAMSTFPKHLRIVRENNFLSLEEAIKRITYLAAETAKIDHIGMLKEGYHADICIFDWDTISETNDFAHPFRKNTGIDYVIVNGEIAVEMGSYKGTRAGRMLKRRR